MDSLTPIEALRAKVAETVAAFERAAAVSYMNDDPAKEQLHAMGSAISTLLQVCEVADATNRAISASLDNKAAEVADEAISRVEAVGMGIVEQLTPKLVALVENTSRQRLVTWRIKSILGTAAVVLIAFALSGGYLYSAGYAAGRTNGELVGHTISAALAAGPVAAADWANLMAWNDPSQALATCEKSTQTDSHGRRYCPMPVWLDPPSSPGS
jgi:hypothetical protein